ncbi:MAG: DUF354 domain-containing protein [Methanotrichaceae archaeon]|nr:DUF354 domain-containing protein [Methanotrichaceae archaeon]
MRILIDTGHPAHVHLFKNFIWEMERRGHRIRVTARDKEVTLQLLSAYSIPYLPIGRASHRGYGLLREWIERDLLIYREARRFRPDCLIGVLNPAVAHSSRLLGRKSLIFTDTEPEAVGFPLADMLTLPFADVILAPTSVRHDYGRRAVRVDSYKELAYLHPDNFRPDEGVVRDLGLSPDGYVILRFIDWNSYHDRGRMGLSIDAKRGLVEEIGRHSRVLISSESLLPRDLERFRLDISPEKLHHLLFYAKMLVCDSQTMATEAGVLGCPVIRCNSFVGQRDMGNFIELEEKYDLIMNCREEREALEKALDLVATPDIKSIWQERRKRCLRDKIDLSRFMVDLVEELPFGR